MIAGSVDAGALSRQRSILMGLAVASVMLFHSRFALPPDLWAIPLRLVQSIGFFGVDVFFLLSGMGLAWSASTPRFHAGRFLTRRLVRLVPTWWAVVAALFLLRALLGTPNALSTLPSHLLGLDFFREGSYTFWFPPAMIATYLLFLATWPLFRRSSRPFALAAGLCGLSWAGGALLSGADQSVHLLIWTTRLPTFFLGVAIGKETAAGSSSLRIGVPTLLASALVGVALWLGFRRVLSDADTWRWGALWGPFFFLALPMSMGAAALAGRIPTRFDWLKSPWQWMGEHSLELYLIHLLAIETVWPKLAPPLRALPGGADLACLAIAFGLAPLLKILATPRVPRPGTPP
jgi:peptidoglycan/LPS O-acetylase OafA/YrhL